MFCLVTTQSFNEGSLDTRTWKCSLFRISCAWISCLSRPMEAIYRRKTKGEFNNPMDKHAVKVVKGNETVGHLFLKFSQIT